MSKAEMEFFCLWFLGAAILASVTHYDTMSVLNGVASFVFGGWSVFTRE